MILSSFQAILKKSKYLENKETQNSAIDERRMYARGGNYPEKQILWCAE